MAKKRKLKLRKNAKVVLIVVVLAIFLVGVVGFIFSNKRHYSKQGVFFD